jgi:hypothetical protein
MAQQAQGVREVVIVEIARVRGCVLTQDSPDLVFGPALIGDGAE